MARIGRTPLVFLLALAAFSPRAWAVCNGPCDVVVELDVTPRTPSDGATLDYTLRYCDTTGEGATVNDAVTVFTSANFVLSTMQWTQCTVTTCTADPNAGSTYGELRHAAFAIAANTCVQFQFSAQLVAGLGGQEVCLQANTTPHANCSRFACISKRSDDPATSSPPIANAGDSTCVDVPGCNLTVTVTPSTLTTCAGSGDSLSASTTGCASGLTYQWTRNGLDILGATGATYTIPLGEPPGGAQYRVRATCAALGCSKLSNQSQVNIAEPTTELVAPSSSCTGQPAAVFVQGSSGTCTINCGNGTPPVNACSTSCTYASTGTFTITANASDGTCSGTHNQSINVISQPVACISPLTSVCEQRPGPTQVTLRNCSTPGVTYQWTTTRGTFDNPAFPEPTITFPTPPVTTSTPVTVTLNASSASCGVPSSTQATFNLLPSPIAQANSSTNQVCTGANLNFSGSASGTPGPFAYSWDFGDGTPPSSQQNPSHSYASPGSKTVILTVTDTNFACASTSSLTVNVTAGPAATATLASCTGNDARFTGQGSGNVTFLWNFGDGQTSTQQNPTHTYASTGPFVVTLTVTDPLTTCSTVRTLNLSIPCGLSCAAVIPGVQLLKAVKQPTPAGVTMSWNSLLEALDGYNVYSVELKNQIPPGRGTPGSVGVCLDVPQAASPACIHAPATPLTSNILFYNTRGQCAASEGL